MVKKKEAEKRRVVIQKRKKDARSPKFHGIDGKCPGNSQRKDAV